MQVAHIVRETKIDRTPRVMQLEGIFDIPPSERSRHEWDVVLPLEDRQWNVGLIVGPSGCGKSTITNEMFKDYIYADLDWDQNKAVLEAFPKEMGIKNISEILNSVGFSSPPSWFKPYHVLSNGEKFRVTMARAIAECRELCVVDEFTSVVDRNVAKCGSFAIAKTVRKYDKKFIAVSCHYDIEDWLQPDWVYCPAENEFKWRLLQRRPDISIEIARVHHSAWQLFKRHHYLTADLNKAACCFVAFIDGEPVAFCAYLHFVNNRLKNTKKGHRLVVLPDYQGVGIGMRLVDYIAGCLSAVGFDFIGRTAILSVNNYRAKSDKWKCISKPLLSQNKGRKGLKGLATNLNRLVATYRYVGLKIDIEEARRVLQCQT